ncbi:hypothetical protein V8C42DRAFT_325793 [Trichoderma barbatum]
MTWTRALQISVFFSMTQRSHSSLDGCQRNLCPPPRVNSYRFSGILRISMRVSSTTPCSPTATSLKQLFGSRPWKWDGAPLTPSPKVKSLAPMHACTKAPVKYYSVLHACEACACATNRASSGRP